MDAYQSQQGMMVNEARKMRQQRIKYRNEKDMNVLRRQKEWKKKQQYLRNY